MKTKLLSEVEQIEACAENLRRQMGVSKRGETLFHSAISMWSDNEIAVEADGNGGALLMVVEGNYPSDYITHRERRFACEDEACEAAEGMIKTP